MKKKEIFWAIVCEEAGICGAFVSKKEAREYEELNKLQFCPAEHEIIKCEIILNEK